MRVVVGAIGGVAGCTGGATWTTTDACCARSPDEEEMHLAVDGGLTASLDTSHSFLSAPPPELVARRDPRQRGGSHGQ